MHSLFRPCLTLAAFALLGAALATPEAAAQTAPGPGQVLINEFRLSGPNGFRDEYIELYCNLDTDCDISDYKLGSYDPATDGDFIIQFPSGTVIPARGHFLIGDSAGYSLPTYGTLDLDATLSTGEDFFVDNQGLRLTAGDETTVIDRVGFQGGGGLVSYTEGTGLQPATSRPADQYAYVRKMGTATGGRPQDTDNNANDFVLISVTGAAHAGVTAPPVLGAPGPQGTDSPPLYDNSQITGSLVEPGVSQASAPNRVRTGTGDSGTLSIRRSLTNNTGETVTYLSFRVIDITTLNSPAVTNNQAQLRLVTSGAAETFTNTQGRTVVIRGTVLEFDAGEGSEPEQPNGGGLNSTVAADLGAGSIAPGETVDVQFLLNVVKAGSFRFYVNVEALAEPAGAPETESADVVGALSPLAGVAEPKGRPRTATLGLGAPQTRVVGERRPARATSKRTSTKPAPAPRRR